MIIKNLLLVLSVFILTSFITTSKTNIYTNTVVVRVVQESNDIAVSVKTSADNKIEFFMFNVEGKLISKLSINGTKKINITQLEKGFYTYDFFSKDEKLKTGKIELK
jgi:hypothetical protein